MGTDGAIQAGLTKLVQTYLAKEWSRRGELMKIERLLIDSGYKPGICSDVKRRVGGATTMLSKGVGIKAGRKPLSAYTRRPGEKHGHFWYVPNVKQTAGEFPHVLADVNYWKTFVHQGLLTAPGDRGCITIFGGDAREHELFADHIAQSETWVETQGSGRTVHEWSPRPTRTDNHWLDGLTGCALAASMVGIRASDQTEAVVKKRKRVPLAELMGRR